MTSTTVQAAVAAEENSYGLSQASAVVQRLTRLGLTVEEAKDAVLDAAADGLVEARPESGMGRSSPAELALMPEALPGCLIGWLRVLS